MQGSSAYGRAAVAVVLAVAAAIVPQSAAAATVETQAFGSKLVYTAAAGEVNDVSVDYFTHHVLVGNAIHRNWLVRVTEHGDAPLVAGAGCGSDGLAPEPAPNVVVCGFAENDPGYLQPAELQLGDGEDRTRELDGCESEPAYRAPCIAIDVHGGPGADRLFVERSADELPGPGRVTLFGDEGADELHSADLPSTLDGGEGDDLLDAGADTDATSADVLLGGPGTDTVDYSARTLPLAVDADGDGDGGLGLGGGDGAVAAGSRPAESDAVGADVEVIRGGSAGDTLIGNALANTLDGGGGPDRLSGLGETDTVSYAARTGPVTADADGGDGATTGRDDGEAGEQDTISADVERLVGGRAGDVLTDDGGSRTLEGGPGPDDLDGGGGGDQLLGGEGDDTLGGGPGPVFDDRGFGPELLENDADLLDGGPGNDLATYAGREDRLALTLGAESASGSDLDQDGDDQPDEGDTLDASLEALRGGDDADQLTGDAGPNRLDGGPGIDLLSGLEGADRVFSRDGVADDVDCGAGGDVVTADPGDTLAACETASPANTGVPVVSGAPEVGSTLTSSAGTWWAVPTPVALAHAWLRCDGAGEACAPIAGATGTTYRLTAADAGRRIRSRVTASNLGGDAEARSAATEAVRAAPPAQRCVVPKLKNLTLAGAKKALAKASCSLGKVTKKRSTGKPGRVLKQSPAPGRKLTAGAKVALVISKR